MLGLGREIITNYHTKIKNDEVTPSDMNGFLRVLNQMSNKEQTIVFENPTQIAYKNIMKDFDIDPLKRIKLEEKGFSFCPEITTKLSLMNLDIKEFPISYSGRTYEQGKKITAFDGLDALYVLAKYRFFN